MSLLRPGVIKQHKPSTQVVRLNYCKKHLFHPFHLFIILTEPTSAASDTEGEQRRVPVSVVPSVVQHGVAHCPWYRRSCFVVSTAQVITYRHGASHRGCHAESTHYTGMAL